ncbi:MAG: NAD-dependent epimerase/dehydratase family protein [Candidatus Goldbacteria bacterium]|nr:NAD-dependent epimerase/dehydratase family protein [Candidatus Goldiibacteriota bacterium]
MQKVLLTGAAGYIGSVATALLLNNGFKVVALDNLMYGGESLLSYWHNPMFKFIKLDITDIKSIREFLKKNNFDAIIHLAAIVGDPACAKNKDLAYKVNMEGSLNLIEAAIKNGVKRFIFASTCSNYGKMSPDEHFVDENSPLAPVSLYAELKVKVENIILNEIEKNDTFCPTCLRFATVYGLSPRMRFDLTVNEFTKELALGRELQVFGEQFWRPYCHVYDIANAIKIVLTAEETKVAYNVFNVGEDEENYQKKMIIGEIIKFIPNAMVKYIFKAEDPRDYRVSFKKIKDILNFKITKKVPDGIYEILTALNAGLFNNPDFGGFYNA